MLIHANALLKYLCRVQLYNNNFKIDASLFKLYVMQM